MNPFVVPRLSDALASMSGSIPAGNCFATWIKKSAVCAKAQGRQASENRTINKTRRWQRIKCGNFNMSKFGFNELRFMQHGKGCPAAVHKSREVQTKFYCE